MTEKDIKFTNGQTVKVITNEKKMFSCGDDKISFRELMGRIGIVNSIATFGKDPVSRYEIGVVFAGDAKDTLPTIFSPEELELLESRVIGGRS